MTFEDRITIPTPEGVDVDLPLAGLGSRFVAALIDGLIWGPPIIALLIVAGSLRNGFQVAIVLITMFLVVFGYDIAFEVLNRGRTPGKAAVRLRAVRASGGPVRFLDSAVRNLLRIVDWLPFFYAIGLFAILTTRSNQRLGDLTAGTLVVHDHRPAPVWTTEQAAPPVHDHAAAWDVSAVSDDDVMTLRRFLERRVGLAAESRTRLALELARRVGPKVGVPPEPSTPSS